MGYAIEYSSQTTNNGGTVTVGSSATQLLAANDNRRTIVLQNLSTSPIFVKFGSGATTSSFSFILPAGTASNDGTGGVFTEDTLSYTGVITAVVSSGTADIQVTEI